jgi:hypothetical protein
MGQEQGTAFNVAMFARGRNADLDAVHVGFDCPKDIVDWLDVVQHADPKTYPGRASLINEILRAWAEKKEHEFTIAQRIKGFNATPAQSGGAA